MYTGPGFLSGLLALINVICLLTLFVDYRLPTSQLTESQKNPINADDDAEARTRFHTTLFFLSYQFVI